MLVSSVQAQNQEISHLDTKLIGQPHDPEGATEASIPPGDKKRLYGWLYLINNTGYPMDVKMRFDLKGGLHISMDLHTENGIIHQEQYISLNETISARLEPILDEQTGEEISTIILYPANQDTQSNAKLGNLRRLSKISNRV